MELLIQIEDLFNGPVDGWNFICFQHFSSIQGKASKQWTYPQKANGPGILIIFE